MSPHSSPPPPPCIAIQPPLHCRHNKAEAVPPCAAGVAAGEAKGDAAAWVSEEQYGAESDEEELLQRMREEIRAEEVGIPTEPAQTGEWQ